MLLKLCALVGALTFTTPTTIVNDEPIVLNALQEQETPVVEETPTTPENDPVWQNKVYTFNDNDEYVYTITLTSETTYELVEENNGLTLKGVYELKDEKLVLKFQDEILFTFIVNADGTLKLAPVITPAQVKSEVDKFLQRFLSPEIIAMIVSWGTFLITTLICVVKLVRTNRVSKASAEKVGENVLSKAKEYVSDSVREEIDKYLPQMSSTMDKTNNILEILSKVMCLTQENSPESRLAVLQLMQDLGVVDKETTETGKEIIKNQEELKEKKKVDTEKQLDAIINDTDGTSI